ncbi:MAG: DUF4147 domain-containing protein [Sedimenticola sp.]|nr:DUF4147 domain-containing protein [Sedimenticola sp.]
MSRLARARKDLLEIFQAGVARVEGRHAVQEALAQMPDQVSLVAIGKAAGSMAQGALETLGDRVVDGLVISKPGHLDESALESAGLRCLYGGHPLPDQSSLLAGEALVDFLQGLPAERQLLFLISGGTSGLVEQLREGLDLSSLQRINQWLLASGLPIGAINRVRKSLSRIKGGGLVPLLQDRPARVLLISDVPGDDPSVIGSGLLVAEPDSLETVHELALPDWLRALLPQQPRPQLPSTDNIRLEIVASLADARQAAAERARELGYPVQVQGSPVVGDVEVVGRRLGYELIDSWPGVYIWGGEPTVRLPPEPGRGGRNQHLALCVAEQIAGNRSVCFLAAGTDGGDGPGEDAGALVDGGTVSRGSRVAGDVRACLARADSGSFLQASGDLLHTGPTGTNVMDLMIGIKW